MLKAVIAMGILAASLSGGIALAQSNPGATEEAPKEYFSERELAWGKSIDKEECAGLKHAVWVEHSLGTECIRYYPSGGLEDPRTAKAAPSIAVLFFHGDHLAGTTPLGNYGKISAQGLIGLMQRNHRQYGVPFILVARPGVYGSSGDHKQRRRPKEFHSLNAAVDAIKARYGLEQVALAGQSGGATSVGAILTLGRKDVKCAAASSGGYAVNELADLKRLKIGQFSRSGCDVTNYCDAYNVIDHVAGIAPDAERTIYIIGDPQDQNTVFELQRRFADRVREAGHRVEIVEAEGRGPERHSLAYMAYKVAGQCAVDVARLTERRVN